MPYEFLRIQKEETIAIITLDRPPVNALNLTAYQEIYDAFNECQQDDSIGAIVFTAAGEKVFTAGLDVKEIAGKSLPEAIAFQRVSRRCLNMIARIRKPTIAAIFGYVLGGALELALACDLRISTPNATIGCPEINLGIIAGSGGTQRLPRLIGMAKAKELLFSGDSVSGEEAYRIGLVNKISPKETLQDEARAWAKKLAAKPKVAMNLLKHAMDMGIHMDLATAINFETDCFIQAYISEDGREGFQAFIEKRKPNFKGR